MPKGPDPRLDPPPVEDVPRLLREGAAEWNAAHFWHAHESWETAWHALRKAGRVEAAEYLKGLIVCAAALENANRGKEPGFKRQFAEGLWLLRTNVGKGTALGLLDEPRVLDALALLYVDAMRRREWAWWRESGWRAPALDFGDRLAD